MGKECMGDYCENACNSGDRCDTHTDRDVFVTREDVEREIVDEYYFTGEAFLDSRRFGWLTADHTNAQDRYSVHSILERMDAMTVSATRQSIDENMGGGIPAAHKEALNRLTFCVLILRNGMPVTGCCLRLPAEEDQGESMKFSREQAFGSAALMVGFHKKQSAMAEAKAYLDKAERRAAEAAAEAANEAPKPSLWARLINWIKR